MDFRQTIINTLLGEQTQLQEDRKTHTYGLKLASKKSTVDPEDDDEYGQVHRTHTKYDIIHRPTGKKVGEGDHHWNSVTGSHDSWTAKVHGKTVEIPKNSDVGGTKGHQLSLNKTLNNKKWVAAAAEKLSKD
jgi:hypothetical protein